MQTYSSQTPKHQLIPVIPMFLRVFRKFQMNSENSGEMGLTDSENSDVFHVKIF